MTTACFRIFIACLILSSCAHKNIFIKCENRNYDKAAILDLTFKFKNQDSLIVKNAKSYAYDSINAINIVEEIPMNAFYFQQLLEVLLPGKADSSIFFTSLYYDSTISTSSLLSYEHIKAIGTYALQGDRYYFRLFTKNNVSYTQVEPLSSLTNYISNNSVLSIARNLVFVNGKNYTIFNVDKVDGKNYSLPLKKGLIPDQIEANSKKLVQVN